MSALLVAPSASKSPMMSTRPRAVPQQELHRRGNTLERADRQQPLERGIELGNRAHATRGVDASKHRVQIG